MDSSISDLRTDFSDNDFTWRIKDTEIIYRQKTPKTIHQYLLGEVLGKGSYAKVREALDTRTFNVVAIKIAKKNIKKLPGSSEASLKQEISIIEKLNHKNVVKYYESFSKEEKEKIYIVIEYVEGGTLQDLINKSPTSRLPLKQAQRYFKDLILGLQYLHSQGIVHRDIKPGNLLLTTDGVLKITDFGSAERIESFEDPNYSAKAPGAPAFQPPEIASGEETFSGVAGDVWAAGVTLFYIVTGKYPFEVEGKTAYTIFNNIVSGKYKIPKWVRLHKALTQLIRGMLEPNKKND